MDLRESIINQNDFTLGLTKQLLQTEGKHSNLSNSTDHLKSLQPEKNQIAKWLFWKLKSQWKQGLGWGKSYNRYNYDLQSYSFNFDDGFDGHRS
ncbi:hypothetical protein FF1_042594 [Malus domestica]